MYITDLIPLGEVATWTNGDLITIIAGTGKGKSHFIKNTLYQHAKSKAKKILMLVHRSPTASQFKSEIARAGKQDVIDIVTYQYLETLYSNGRIFDFSKYEYIVIDEYHYFLSDALFNPLTDISLNIIMSLNDKIRILMSATADKMESYLANIKGITTKNYTITPTYDFIESLNFFYTDAELEHLAQNIIAHNQKGIIFEQSAQKAYDLYSKFKDHSLFCCSRSNDDGYYNYVDEPKINTMLEQERFNEPLLITTTCLDAGVNIIDDDLKHIIVDVKDIDTLIQCIGRKRLTSDDDKIHVYVKCPSNNHLGGLIQKMKKRMEMAEYRLTHSLKEYVLKYGRQSSEMVFDVIIDGQDNACDKAVNEMAYHKCKTTIDELCKMIQMEYGFARTVASKLGKSDGNYNVLMLEEVKKMDDLKLYMESIVGKRLFKEEQQDLINKVQLKDGRGRLQKSISILNAYFEENKLPYQILAKRTSQSVDGKVKSIQYWEVANNIDR